MSKGIEKLVLWLDCDREGEAIAFDCIEVCKNSNKRQNFEIFRAHFSALTKEQILFAMNNLKRPNKNLADAVLIRKEIDLRIGASFTRFLTLSL